MQFKYIIGHKYVSTEWHGWLSVMLSERGQVAEIKIVHLYKILEQAKQVLVEKKKERIGCFYDEDSLEKDMREHSEW